MFYIDILTTYICVLQKPSIKLHNNFEITIFDFLNLNIIQLKTYSIGLSKSVYV